MELKKFRKEASLFDIAVDLKINLSAMAPTRPEILTNKRFVSLTINPEKIYIIDTHNHWKCNYIKKCQSEIVED